MNLKHKIIKYLKECLGIEKQENSFIEDDNVEIVDLPEDLVINLNNEQRGENGEK